MNDELAAVDLGSHSFHMIVARLDGGRLVMTDRMREPVCLGAGLDPTGCLEEDAQKRALECLARFGQRIHRLPSGRVRAVGTNTLRKARNSAGFIKRAQGELGHPIEVIGGREEARLIYLGAAQSVSGQEKRLVIDIGGGSTELIVGRGAEILGADSLFMGCVSFSRRYFRGGVVDAKRFARAETAAQLELQSLVGAYRELGWERALGCSGTIHAVHTIARANGWTDNGLTKKAIKRLKKALLTAGRIEDVQLSGLAIDRKSVIAGGVAILKATFEALEIESMTPSPGALREGALFDLMGRIRHEDARDRTIQWFQQQYRVDVRHAQRVADTASNLLLQVTKGWALDAERGGQLLNWAAQLHEIGGTISHIGSHKHGAYIVRNADMAGFSRDDQQVLSALILGHRRKFRPESFASLSAPDEAVRLTALLRLAITLHRSRSQDQKPPAHVRVKKARIILSFPNGWLEAHPLTRADLSHECGYLRAVGFELEVREQD